MTRRNRLIALLLAIVMTVAGSVTALAEEVTGTRSNPGDTAGPNVNYDSVMGTGYVYSDQHPEVTDPEFLIKKYYCYPGEPDFQEVEPEFAANTKTGTKIPYNNPYSNNMKEALPLLQEFVYSFDWIHSDEKTRFKHVFGKIADGNNGNKYDTNSVVRRQQVDETFMVLRMKTGQCENFAKELAELCKIVGLECVTYQPSEKHLANLVKIGEQWYAVDPTQNTSVRIGDEWYAWDQTNQQTTEVPCKAVDYDAEYNRFAREFEASPDGERMRQWREIGQRLEAGEITQEECERLNNELWQKTDEQILAEMAAR